MQLEQYIAAQIVRHRTRRGFSTLFADFQEIQMREVVLQHPKSDEQIENEKKQAHQLLAERVAELERRVRALESK
jgi:hypothetical protein